MKDAEIGRSTRFSDRVYVCIATPTRVFNAAGGRFHLESNDLETQALC